jgi:ATP-binding cassette subfamily F protein 3
MSGGEKARLVLAMMVWQRPNLLLLDEPTNHLDLATREALAMALNEFEGTLMLVSHDRALLRAVCDEFWLVGRGAVGPFDGDLDDYQRYLLDEAKRLREAAKVDAKAQSQAPALAAPPPVAAPPAVAKPVAAKPTAAAPAAAPAPGAGGADQRKQSAQARQQLAEKTRPLRKEIEKIDQRLPVLQAERAALEARLQEALPAGEIAAAGRRLKEIAAEIESCEERWLQLSEEIEALSAA